MGRTKAAMKKDVAHKLACARLHPKWWSEFERVEHSVMNAMNVKEKNSAYLKGLNSTISHLKSPKVYSKGNRVTIMKGAKKGKSKPKSPYLGWWVDQLDLLRTNVVKLFKAAGMESETFDMDDMDDDEDGAMADNAGPGFKLSKVRPPRLKDQAPTVPECTPLYVNASPPSTITITPLLVDKEGIDQLIEACHSYIKILMITTNLCPT